MMLHDYKHLAKNSNKIVMQANIFIDVCLVIATCGLAYVILIGALNYGY